MNGIWKKEQGSVREADLASLIKRVCSEGKKDCCAFYTDHFQGTEILDQNDERLQRILEDKAFLLELRVFDRNSELYLFRSAIGGDFTYRIADDLFMEAHLAEQGSPFLQKREAHLMEQVQLIDIDSGYKPWNEGQTDSFGARMIRTTGGGTYQLPLERNEDAIIVVSYIAYDENGTACIADYRWAGYANENEWRKNHESC